MSKKLLIVEDDSLLLGMYKVKFQNSGFDVIVAGDGVDAMDTIKHEKPQALLTDWMMPKLDGEHMIRKIRKELGSDIPIGVVSNSFLEKDKKTAEQLGVKFFLTKADTTPAMVVKKVEEMLIQ